MQQKRKIDWNKLLVQAKQGDKSAEEELFSNLRVSLRPLVESKLRRWSLDDQQDILQETLITFWQKRDIVTSNPHLYAREILRNKIGHALRSHKQRRSISIEPDDSYNAQVVEGEIEQTLHEQGTEDRVVAEIEKQEYACYIE